MKTIIDAKPWLKEPALIPLPWNSNFHISPSKPLKIGVMWHDAVIMPHPPVTRALREVVSKLKDSPNFEVVEWKPHEHIDAWSIISSLFFTDGAAGVKNAIKQSGDPMLPLTKWITDRDAVKDLSRAKLEYWEEEREAYRKEYSDAWNETATGRNEEGEAEGVVDVILCPVSPGVAPKHNTAYYWGYTSAWNLLDYPALVFPVSKVDKAKDASYRRTTWFREEFLGNGEHTWDQEVWELCENLNL